MQLRQPHQVYEKVSFFRRKSTSLEETSQEKKLFFQTLLSSLFTVVLF
jgi:hypothetical protein